MGLQKGPIFIYSFSGNIYNKIESHIDHIWDFLQDRHTCHEELTNDVLYVLVLKEYF